MPASTADPRFRPEHYHDVIWGCSVDFRFPMVKLIDRDTPEAWPALEAIDNPFALVVMAQIRAKATKDPDSGYALAVRPSVHRADPTSTHTAESAPPSPPGRKDKAPAGIPSA